MGSNKDKKPDTELALAEPQPLAIIPNRPSVAQMEQMILEDKERTNLIVNYVKDSLVSGIDYGKAIDLAKKDSLLKPGAEKTCRLFKTHARWLPDDDTHRMYGSPPNVVCLRCEIIDNATGAVLGEGRGSGEKGPQNRDYNKATKIAEKRALVDACLYTFCLSEFFTQDMEAGAGREAAKLMRAKAGLIEKAEEYRSGTESKLTARLWLVEIVKVIYSGRKVLNTPGECDRIATEFKNFDKATGQKKDGKAKPEAKAKEPAEPAKKPLTPLEKAKIELLRTVRAARARADSSMDDKDFIVAVIESVYKRKTLKTVAECKKIATEFKNFDLATGQLVPD